MAATRLVAIRCAAVAAAALAAASIPAACSSFSGDAGPLASDEAGADSGSEVAAPADAGPETSPPCDEAKVAGDPDNCGKCGHSCLGGACVTGSCMPAVLTTFMANVAYGPVLDSSRAVVVTQIPAGRVEWCQKSGCAGGLVGVDLPTVATSRRALVSDGTSAFVGTLGGNSAGVFRLGQDGILRAITPVDGTFQNADDLAVDGTDILFFNAYQTGPIGFYRVPGDGSGPAGMIVPAVPSDRWAYLIGRPGRIYAGDFQRIGTCAGATCPAFDVYAAPAVTHLDITAMATDGTSMFWTSDRSELLTCPLGATCPAPGVVLGTTPLEGSTPIALSVHGPDLYITTDAGKIFTCVAASCATTFKTLATDEVIEGTAVDDAAVYWIGRSRIDAGGGLQGYRLMRLAK